MWVLWTLRSSGWILVFSYVENGYWRWFWSFIGDGSGFVSGVVGFGVCGSWFSFL